MLSAGTRGEAHGKERLRKDWNALLNSAYAAGGWVGAVISRVSTACSTF